MGGLLLVPPALYRSTLGEIAVQLKQSNPKKKLDSGGNPGGHLDLPDLCLHIRL